jgi:hypothetical protein
MFDHFLAVKSGRFDLPFAEKMQQFLEGKQVVVLSAITLSGKPFEDKKWIGRISPQAGHPPIVAGSLLFETNEPPNIFFCAPSVLFCGLWVGPFVPDVNRRRYTEMVGELSPAPVRERLLAVWIY